MPRAATIVALCLLAMALVACGEKEETDSTAAVATTESTTDVTETTTADPVSPPGSNGATKLSTEERIERIVQAVVGGADPQAACSQLVTAQYVKTAYGDAAGCRAAVSAQKPFDVTVSAIEVEDPGAAANARPAGGPNRGEKLEVRLVRAGESWRVSYVRSNAPAGP